MFYRFLSTLADEDEDVRALAEQTMTLILTQKNPSKFHQHFVEALFYLNQCEAHPKYNQVRACPPLPCFALPCLCTLLSCKLLHRFQSSPQHRKMNARTPC